jgi:hypothetical protein
LAALYIQPSSAGRTHPRVWLPRINSGGRTPLPKCWAHFGWCCRLRKFW